METFKIVYLIDDDPLVNLINQKVISIAKFSGRTEVFSGASVAIEALKKINDISPEEFPDIIFLDINMPGMDGWQFLEEYKHFPAQIIEKCKVFMLSSSIDSKEINKSKTYTTVYDFISKPISFAALEKIRPDQGIS